MTDPRSKTEILGETTKTHLIDVYVSNKYGRNTDINTKYTNKGMMVEEDSLTLYSRHKKTFYKKNEQHMSNEFIKGTPDIIHGDTIIDVKSSWDIFTFHRTKAKKLKPMYYWQLQGYMGLTGKSKAVLAYCLIDTPELLINDEKRKLMWKMNAGTDQNEDYEAACQELDKLMIYSDIPMEEKIIEISFQRNDEDINRLYERIKECRKYIETL
jgi:hypothetical protein